jgi:hypothetical protein
MTRRLKRRNASRILSKLWLPAVLVAVVGIVSFGVSTVPALSVITNPPVTVAIPAAACPMNPDSRQSVHRRLDRIPLEKYSEFICLAKAAEHGG